MSDNQQQCFLPFLPSVSRKRGVVMLGNRRTRLGSKIAIALAILLAGVSAASATTYYWADSADDWSSGARWTPNGLSYGVVPGSGDTAYVGNGGTVSVSDAESVNTLNLGCTVSPFAGNGTVKPEPRRNTRRGSGRHQRRRRLAVRQLLELQRRNPPGERRFLGYELRKVFGSVQIVPGTTSTIDTQGYTVTMTHEPTGEWSGTTPAEHSTRPAAAP